MHTRVDPTRSDVVLEVYLVWAYWRIVPAQIFGRASVLLIGRYALASLPMALWLCLTSGSDLGLWALVPCIPIYAALCWLMRCLDPGHFTLVHSASCKSYS